MTRVNRAGFSLLEVIVVVGIGAIVTATAVPNMVTAISNMRLRSSMTSLAGVIQNCRMLAVKQNQTMTTISARNPTGSLRTSNWRRIPAYTTHDFQFNWSPAWKRPTPSGPNAASGHQHDAWIFFTAER